MKNSIFYPSIAVNLLSRNARTGETRIHQHRLERRANEAEDWGPSIAGCEALATQAASEGMNT